MGFKKRLIGYTLAGLALLSFVKDKMEKREAEKAPAAITITEKARVPIIATVPKIRNSSPVARRGMISYRHHGGGAHLHPPVRYDEGDYIPHSKEECLSIMEQAVGVLDKNPEGKNEFYTALCQFYNAVKDNQEIDLNDPSVRKAFLASKKILKRGAHFVENKEGRYNEQSYLLGIDAKAFYQLQQTATRNVRTFCSDLCNNTDVFKMLDPKDDEQAEAIAAQLFQEKLEAYGAQPQDASFQYSKRRDAAYTYNTDNSWNDWQQHVTIRPNTEDDPEGQYCPLSVRKAHILGHVMQMMPGEKENYGHQLRDLAPAIDLIVMQDTIYKKMHNIPLEEEVSYFSSSSSQVNMGKIANTFRKIKEQYNLRSYEDVLLTPEANKAINTFVTQKDVSNTLASHRGSR